MKSIFTKLPAEIMKRTIFTLLIAVYFTPVSSFAKTATVTKTPIIATGVPLNAKYVSPDGKYYCDKPWRGIWCDGNVTPKRD